MKFQYNEIQVGLTRLHLLTYEPFDVHLFDHYLSPDEKGRMSSFQHIKRKREFLATRILCQRLFGKKRIQYNEHGAPYIGSTEHISISHSKNIVGIAINPEFVVGLDLEPHRENIFDLVKKFISEHEKNVFDVNSTLEMTKMWSAKEALYKLAGRKKIIFSTELLLDKEDNGCWIGTIVNPDHHLSVKLDIFELNDTIVSLNTEAIVRIPNHN